MLRDLWLLLWLRARHTWIQAVFWVRTTGADLEAARSLWDWAYLAYLMGLFGGWAFLMWIMALSKMADAFAGLSPAELRALSQVAAAAPLAVFAVLSARSMHSSPLKLTSADIAYVGASPLATPVLFGLEAAVQSVRAGMLGLLLGYLLGAGMSAAGTGASAQEVAILTVLIAIAVVLGAWIAGAARLGLNRRWQGWVGLTVWLGVVVVALVPILRPQTIVWPRVAVTTALGGGGVLGHLAALGGLVVFEWVALVSLARRADMTAVICESGLYAELQPLRFLRRYDPAAYREIARRKRLARRLRPRFHLPIGVGLLAPISRALLSYARQPGRIVPLIVWGGMVAPAGVVLITWGVSPLAYVPWIAVGISGVSTEMTRSFRDDVQRPSIRGSLPFGTLLLLLLDSIPAMSFSIAVSSVVLVAAYRPGTSLGAGLVLAALLSLVVVLCRGIGMIDHPLIGRPLSFEAAMVVALLAITLGALLGGPWLAVTAAAFAAGVAGTAVQAGHE